MRRPGNTWLKKFNHNLILFMDQSNIKFALLKDAEWCNILGFSDFDGMNRILRDGKAVQLVNLCEAKHEFFFSQVAKQIIDNHAIKIVMMAGPSSSGKTSTSLRIAQQLKVHGVTPKVIELDNFFVEREQTPKLANGQYDFECLEAMDLDLLNETIFKLVTGERVEIPRFDFVEGKKRWEGNYMQIGQNEILMMEGIHALDPAMSPKIPRDFKFNIYLSDISSISEYDPHIHMQDNRLLRRITRDNLTRGTKPEKTIIGWDNVLAGEQKYIIPFHTEADVTFNSTLQYELPLLKYYVTPLLKDIDAGSPAFAQAHRLLTFLENLDGLPVNAINAIPCTSVIREFIGGQKLFRDF